MNDLVIRKLKNDTWVYDPTDGEIVLQVTHPEGHKAGKTQEIWLNKTQMFSLMRFFTRVAQKMTQKKKKAKVSNKINILTANSPRLILDETSESSS